MGELSICQPRVSGLCSCWRRIREKKMYNKMRASFYCWLSGDFFKHEKVFLSLAFRTEVVWGEFFLVIFKTFMSTTASAERPTSWCALLTEIMAVASPHECAILNKNAVIKGNFPQLAPHLCLKCNYQQKSYQSPQLFTN